MSFIQSAMAAILFCKMRPNFAQTCFHSHYKTLPANLVKISLYMNEILRFMLTCDKWTHGQTDGHTYGRCLIIS